MSELLRELRTCGTTFMSFSEKFDAKVFADYIAEDNVITFVRLILRDNSEIKTLTDGLRKNTTVKHLELFYVDFSVPEIITAVAESGIEHLKLYESIFTGCDFSILSVESLALASDSGLTIKQLSDIVSGPKLKSLTIWEEDFDNEATTIIAEVISSNKLTKLSLLSCKFTDLLYNAVKVNTSLTYLNLSTSNVNVGRLSDVLRNNKTLKSLNLSYSSCNDDNFAILLQTNLKKFYARNSNIRNFSVLKDNTSLVEFVCSGAVNFATLADVISENTTLKSVTIDNHNIPEIDLDSLKRIVKSLRRNTTLKSISLYPLNSEDPWMEESVNERKRLIIKWLGSNYTLKKFGGLSDDPFFSKDKRGERLDAVRRLMCTKRCRQ